MSLESWRASGWLSAHQPTHEEIARLLAIADRDLEDCRREELSADWKFAIAYNAVLQAATAALAAAGYRAARDSHHYRVLQSLSLTVSLPCEQVSRLDAFRKKREPKRVREKRDGVRPGSVRNRRVGGARAEPGRSVGSDRPSGTVVIAETPTHRGGDNSGETIPKPQYRLGLFA